MQFSDVILSKFISVTIYQVVCVQQNIKRVVLHG